jgi:hypothetical protein
MGTNSKEMLGSANYVEIAWLDDNMWPVGLGNSLYKDVEGPIVSQNLPTT